MTDINGIVEEQISRWEATRFYVENDFPVTISKGNPIIDESISAWLALEDVLALHEIDEDNYTLRYEGNDHQVRDETCQCGDDYPCETRTAITNRLGGGHEPNQVTKDAIEEARNQNDTR